MRFRSPMNTLLLCCIQPESPHLTALENGTLCSKNTLFRVVLSAISAVQPKHNNHVAPYLGGTRLPPLRTLLGGHCPINTTRLCLTCIHIHLVQQLNQSWISSRHRVLADGQWLVTDERADVCTTYKSVNSNIGRCPSPIQGPHLLQQLSWPMSVTPAAH